MNIYNKKYNSKSKLKKLNCLEISIQIYTFIIESL